METSDTSVIAQLGWPDMRLPILYSMSWPRYPDVDTAVEKLRYAIYDAQTIDTDGSRTGETFALD